MSAYIYMVLIAAALTAFGLYLHRKGYRE